jgi:hypothetical protein
MQQDRSIRYDRTALLTARLPRVRHGGFSMLELQISLVLFGIALTGFGPLVVMHSRQLAKLEKQFSPHTTYYLVPPAEPWARKLGAAASVATSSSAGQSNGQPVAVNDVQIQLVDKTLESQTVTAWVTVKSK